MSTSRVAPQYPFLVFGAAVIAFGVWIAYDATARGTGTAEAREQFEAPLPPPVAAPSLSAAVPAAPLATIRPGLPRLAAEQQLTMFPQPKVDPIDLSSGKPVLRSHYLIKFPPPVAPVPPSEFVPGPCVLTVEFDGGTSGHPVTRVALEPAPESN